MSDLPVFIEKRFPAMPGWEYTVLPAYTVRVTATQQAERRNLKAAYPRRRIQVRVPADREADIVLVNKWHHALRGRAIGFRVQDFSDYLSVDLNPYEDPGTATAADRCSPTDQPLFDLGNGTYQLMRSYQIDIDVSDKLTQNLPIVKPVAGTIRVANAGEAEQTETEDWTIDYATGILTPTGGFSGIPYSWGGQFDLPMRFDSDLPIDIRSQRVESVSFDLLELRAGDL